MSEQHWHYIDQQGQQHGPVDANNLQALAQAGAINTETQVWTEGLEEWIPASKVDGLIPAPPEVVTSAAQPQVTPTAPMIPSTPTTAPVQGSPASSAIHSTNPYTTPSTPEATGEILYPPTIRKGGSFGLYLSLLLGGMGMMILGLFIMSQSSDAALIALGVIGIGYIGMIASGVLTYIYLYKAWACLQPGGATISPGQAIGFMFIPLFNIVWIFMAIGGLPRQWNEITSRYKNTQSAPKMSIGPFICMLLVPLIGHILWISQTLKAINFMASIGKFGSQGSSTGGSGLSFAPTTIKGASSNLKFK